MTRIFWHFLWGIPKLNLHFHWHPGRGDNPTYTKIVRFFWRLAGLNCPGVCFFVCFWLHRLAHLMKCPPIWERKPINGQLAVGNLWTAKFFSGQKLERYTSHFTNRLANPMLYQAWESLWKSEFVILRYKGSIQGLPYPSAEIYGIQVESHCKWINQRSNLHTLYIIARNLYSKGWWRWDITKLRVFVAENNTCTSVTYVYLDHL